MKGARTYIVALAVLALVLIGTKVSATKLIAEFEGFEEKPTRTAQAFGLLATVQRAIPKQVYLLKKAIQLLEIKR